MSLVPNHPKVVELVNAWGWEEYGSQNSNWEATHFWENVFLTSWASKCLEMHAHPIFHPSVWLSHAFWSSCTFSFMSWLFPPFYPWLEIHFGLAESMCSKDSRFGGFLEAFLSPSRSWSLLCIYLHVFSVISSFSHTQDFISSIV